MQLVILAGDLSASYDGFHSQNRHARSGMGNSCSHAMGFALLLTILDQYRSEGIAGISQRLGANLSPPLRFITFFGPLPFSTRPLLPLAPLLPLPSHPPTRTPAPAHSLHPLTHLPSRALLEKEGLKVGLLRLIVEYGLPLADLCTDQCRGAPSDIKLVLSEPEVQKMLRYAPAKMRAWSAQQLGSREPMGAGMSAEEGARPWAHVAAEMRAAMAAMAAIAPDDLVTIVHHFDVFHVEVKLVEAYKKFVMAGAVLGGGMGQGATAKVGEAARGLFIVGSLDTLLHLLRWQEQRRAGWATKQPRKRPSSPCLGGRDTNPWTSCSGFIALRCCQKTWRNLGAT